MWYIGTSVYLITWFVGSVYLRSNMDEWEHER